MSLLTNFRSRKTQLTSWSIKCPELLTNLDRLDDTITELNLSEKRIFSNNTTLLAVAGFMASLGSLGTYYLHQHQTQPY
jgi:hypothetical protein